MIGGCFVCVDCLLCVCVVFCGVFVAVLSLLLCVCFVSCAFVCYPCVLFV